MTTSSTSAAGTITTGATTTPTPNPVLSLPAPAKLNLFLHITGQRDDGYHTLQTLFQLLDFGDLLHFRTAEPGELSLVLSSDSSASSVQNNIATEDNLVYRAAVALRTASRNLDSTNVRTDDDLLPGVEIELIKRLPIGGGLGGGSSDAATTLVGLNRFWQLGLSTEALCQLGATLGADIPVFIRGHSAWAEGIGDQLTPVELEPCWYLVIKPNCAVSTAAIFQHPRLTRDTSPITIRAFFSGPDLGELALGNDCLAITESLHSEVAEARGWLDQYAPASMTGTGACVFARFTSREQCEQVLAKLPGQWHGFASKGVNISPLYG